jgi:cell wall-associated NlpC family hydrolase
MAKPGSESRIGPPGAGERDDRWGAGGQRRGGPAVIVGALGAVAAAGLAVVAVGVSLAGGAASITPPATGGIYGGALKAGVIPDATLAPWVEQAGGLCPEFTPAVIAAQIQQESGWNPNVVSSAGAEGISQFLPGTWLTWAKDDDGTGNVTPFNPRDAIMAQGRFDCSLAAAVAPIAATSGASVLSLALAGYNAGLGAVRQYQGIPPYPQTQDYVRSIEALAASYVVAPVPGAAGFGGAVVAAAEKWLGTPYVWGGGSFDGPTGGGFDCSGLVLYSVYQASGGQVRLPHSSQIQATMGQAVPLADIMPGDVIAFALNGGTDFDHIVIYIGNGQIVQAPHTGDVVKLDTLNSWWLSHPMAIRRFG